MNQFIDMLFILLVQLN